MNTKRSSSTVPSPIERLWVALMIGLVVTAVTYVVVRLVDVVLFPEPNPIVVIWTDRSRFAWRALIATYLGGAAVFAGYEVATRNPAHLHIVLERALLGSGIVLLLQAIFAP